MTASHYYSHKQLHKCSGAEKQEMLFQKGINWNDYPAAFKRGTFYQRAVLHTKFTPAELSSLPQKHAAHHNPELTISRNCIRCVNMPPFSTVINKTEVIFDGAAPLTE